MIPVLCSALKVWPRKNAIEPASQTAATGQAKPFLLHAAEKTTLPRQPQMVLHKTVNNT